MWSMSGSTQPPSSTRSMWSMVGGPHEVYTARLPARHGKPWTRRELRSLKRMVRRGLSIPSMASKLERSHNSVAWRLYDGGVVGGTLPIHTDTGVSAAAGLVPRTVPAPRELLRTLADNYRYGDVVVLRQDGATVGRHYECLGGVLFHRVMLLPDGGGYKRVNDGRSLILLVPEETND